MSDKQYRAQKAQEIVSSIAYQVAWVIDDDGGITAMYDDSIDDEQRFAVIAHVLAADVLELAAELEKLKDSYGIAEIRQIANNLGTMHREIEIGELRAELAQLREWRDPANPPADGVRVLVRIGENRLVKIAHHLKEFMQWETDDGLYYHGDSYSMITGWKLLPEAGGEG